MSAKATFWAWNQDVKPATAKLVLMCLANCHNDCTDQCNPSIRYISKMTGLNIKTIPSAIKILESGGLISAQKQVKRAANYTINIAQYRGIGTPDNGITQLRGIATPENGSKHTPKTGKEPKIEPKKKLKGGEFKPEKLELPKSVNSQAWIDWCDYRRERKPLITQRSANLTVKLLADYEFPIQQEMVDSSIRAGYQGVFALKNYTGKPQNNQIEEQVF